MLLEMRKTACRNHETHFCGHNQTQRSFDV